MKDFDIAKYLREHQLGSYGILNHYVDLKPLNEEIDLDSFKDFFNKNYSHIYHNCRDRDIQSFLRGKESLPLKKQADLFADYITSQDLGDVVAEDLTPTKGEYVVYYKTREMDKPKEYVRVKGKQKAETAWFNSHEFYKDDDKDYQWGYWPAEKWDAWVSKTVSEDMTPEETAEIPYKGPNPKLDGFGDEFEQADPVSEDMDDAMKYPLTVFIEAVKAAKAAGVPKDRMHYFIDVFAEGAEQVFGRYWDPSNPSKASIKAIGGDKKTDQISKAIKDLISSGVSIKQIKDFVDKQLVRDADSAVFENISDPDKLDSMLADSHPDIGSAADIISSTIKVLRNEKFSDQEIIDFLASLDSLDPSKF